MRTLHWITLLLGTGSLCSCAIVDEHAYSSDQAYSYNEVKYYTQYTDGAVDYGSSQPGYGREVSVPESYHVGAYRSPASPKERDREWVNNQSPQNYTIEIANDPKASQVAKKLYQAPKTNRMAEIPYQRDGMKYYKGVYGSFSSKEEAQKALEALPEDIKQSSGIKTWGSVQSAGE